jgi:hypothetical protein
MAVSFFSGIAENLVMRHFVVKIGALWCAVRALG